ncbi:unnamed protein product, partial [Prorocentrum cordatum]
SAGANEPKQAQAPVGAGSELGTKETEESGETADGEGPGAARNWKYFAGVPTDARARDRAAAWEAAGQDGHRGASWPLAAQARPVSPGRKSAREPPAAPVATCHWNQHPAHSTQNYSLGRLVSWRPRRWFLTPRGRSAFGDRRPFDPEIIPDWLILNHSLHRRRRGASR